MVFKGNRRGMAPEEVPMSVVDPSQVGMAEPETLVDSGRWPWASALVGGLLGVLGAWAIGFEAWRVALFGALGAYAFASLGPASVARLRAVVDRHRGAPSGLADLWDPWLDEGGTGRRAQDAGADAIIPARALVRPRVLSSDGGSFCLEDEIRPFAEGDYRGAIRIDGPTGSGKSTALQHLLAALPPELDVRVFDGPEPPDLADHSCLVIYASDAPASPKQLATFFLAPWGEDELIEYLLAVSSKRCGSVMARLKAADDRSLAEGSPELWRVVLDRMIADESVAGVRQALRRELSSRLGVEALRERVGDYCLWKSDIPVPKPPDIIERDAWRSQDEALHRLIRHQSVRLLVAADRLVDELATADAHCKFLSRRLPRELVREAGLVIRERPEAILRLATTADGDDPRQHATAASLLHAADAGWRPIPGRSPRLSHAYLDGVDWPGVVLPMAEMNWVEMYDACLWKATLDSARLEYARLRRAMLNAASLRGANLSQANLDFADLSSSQANAAIFHGTSLKQARLESASLRSTAFGAANLTGARLRKADLTEANLENAIIDGADFSEAILESAMLLGLTLSKANFAGANFADAYLRRCNLEGMELPGARFPGAKLNEALLTGSIMPKANFTKADLRNAGLAEVSWEGACLAGADLRWASFHMGSSRSGLVNSPIASEGSRTGFYTDDFDEQDFKSPEEIRKADLRGVDLRGAKIEGVDFYLVDLRGATFDASQAHHLRQSGAILRDRRG
jgi:uncharacterized protein YjbI with pentapeptide repeats/energy-coupling factor transporter ATP-binding protein EcfA2